MTIEKFYEKYAREPKKYPEIMEDPMYRDLIELMNHYINNTRSSQVRYSPPTGEMGQ